MLIATCSGDVAPGRMLPLWSRSRNPWEWRTAANTSIGAEKFGEMHRFHSGLVGACAAPSRSTSTTSTSTRSLTSRILTQATRSPLPLQNAASFCTRPGRHPAT